MKDDATDDGPLGGAITELEKRAKPAGDGAAAAGSTEHGATAGGGQLVGDSSLTEAGTAERAEADDVVMAEDDGAALPAATAGEVAALPDAGKDAIGGDGRDGKEAQDGGHDGRDGRSDGRMHELQAARQRDRAGREELERERKERERERQQQRQAEEALREEDRRANAARLADAKTAIQARLVAQVRTSPPGPGWHLQPLSLSPWRLCGPVCACARVCST